MSNASSNRSVVRDGVDYEEVYPSGHVDQESLGEDRSLSAPPRPQQMRIWRWLNQKRFLMMVRSKH